MSRSRLTGRIRTECGISLLELLIVVGMFGMFLAAVQESTIVGLRVVNAAGERSSIRLQLANTLERLTRDARMARNVDLAEATRFQFDADFDGNGGSSGSEQNIDYQVQNGVLNRIQDITTVTLVPDLDTVTFDYIDLNGNDMTPPVTAGNRANIRVVQVTITAAEDDESVSMSTSVFLTNM